MRHTYTIPLIFFLWVFTSGLCAQTPTFDWAVSIGETATSSGGNTTIVDPAGNVYVAGRFFGTIDFDPSVAGSFPMTSMATDVFILKLDVTGNFVWAKQIGGTGDDFAKDIAIDAAGNLYLTGDYQNTVDFDPGAGTTNLTAKGSYDIFVLKLDVLGNFVWARSLGGSLQEDGTEIEVDAFGNVFTTGAFVGTADFDPGPGTFNLTAPGLQADAFVSKLDPSGNFLWAVRIGSTQSESGRGLATDDAGNVFLTGGFETTVDFDPGPATFNLTSNGLTDIFICKLNAAGNLVWAKKVGGTDNDVGESLVVDGSGNVYLTGGFNGTPDFDPGPGTYILTAANTPGYYDAFILKLDNNGNFVWARGIGGPGTDYSNTISLDVSGNVYIAGEFDQICDFDPGPAIFNMTPVSSDGYLLKLNGAGNFISAQAITGPGTQQPLGMNVNAQGHIATTGYFTNNADFDPGPGVFNLTAVGANSIFVQQLTSVPNPPVIANFSPSSGPVGTTVTINGTDFSSIPVNNIVYFGATRASVTAATSTQLTVTVPVGATYKPISVQVGALTGYSSQRFIVSFPVGPINLCALATRVDFTAGTGARGIVIKDFDGDGKADMAIANGNVNLISVFKNTATVGTITTASFAPKVDFPTAAFPFNLTSDDIDGDGKPDLIVANANANSVSVFRNLSTTGSISFAAKIDFTTGPNSQYVAVRDLDGDGKPDIAVPNGNGSPTPYQVSIFRNLSTPGNIAFAPKVDFPTGNNPSPIAIEDLDNDQRPEIVVANISGANKVSILKNGSTIGTLAFAPSIEFASGNGPVDIAIGDIDLDGKPDIATVASSGGVLSIYQNLTTTGVIDATSFAPRVDFAVVVGASKLAIGDFNGDGKPDVVVGSGDRLSIFRNTATPGTIDPGAFANKVDFVNSISTGGVALGDLDGDGKTDIVETNISNLAVVYQNTIFPPPTFSNFSPANGSAGTTVTLTGTNFSTTPANNIVRFNGITATVMASTATSITATVPVGTTTGPITVTVGCITATGTPDFTINLINACRDVIALDGSSAYVEIADDVSLRPSTLTVEALINLSSFPANGTVIGIAIKRTGTSNDANWQLELLNRNEIRFSYWDGTGYINSDTDASPISNLNEWYHVAATYVGGTVKLYVNGSLLETFTGLPPLRTDFTGEVQIGRGYDGYLDAQLDEVRIWNVGRTASELLNNVNGPLTGTEPGLVAYYDMNETGAGLGITVSNKATATGNALDGLTFGSASSPMFINTCASCIPASERAALVALYNSTSGATWSNKSNWLSPNESTWFGVTISGCHVTNLILDNNNLIGTIPSDMSDLVELTDLDLSSNQLYGSIPSELGDLGALKMLDLSRNQLSGDIPTELGNLGVLQSLLLSENNLSGAIPDELGGLSGLLELNLSHNFLNGGVPDNFSNLTLLKFFSVAYNELVFITNALGSLPSLVKLDLSHNLIIDIPQFTTGSITRLAVEYNNLDFGDLEPNIAVEGFTYNPQYPLPPGGVASYIIGGSINIFFDTPGSGNSYQWYRAGVPEPGQNTFSLSKTNMTVNDAGFYVLHVTSSVVPGITLETIPYFLYTDPCGHDSGSIGDNDATFDPHIDDPTTVSAIERQSSGKVIAVMGSTTINSVSVSGIIRFNTDGSLDNSFDAGFSPGGGANQLLVQPDDKILITDYGSDAYILRLNEDGTTDDAFNSNAPSYYSGTIRAIALQSDGKIIVVRQEYMGTIGIDRLNADGTIDPSFSAPDDLEITVVRVQNDDKVLLGGDFPGGIKRLLPDGSVDTGFTGSASANVMDIAVQSDGKIIISGGFSSYNGLPAYRIARLNSDGSIDPLFNGLNLTTDLESADFAYKILIQGDGKIILGGQFTAVNGAPRKDLVRLNPDGTVDCTFDSNAGGATIYDMELQADGNILIAGDFTTYDGAIRNGMARVLNGGIITSCVPSSERAALVALYNSTNGSSWVQKTNWLNADESTWVGVSVNACHVTNIVLESNNLSGPIPVELGNLTDLKELRLPSNHLTGIIPTSVQNLTSLQFLILEYNSLSGTLPAAIGNITALREFSAKSNALTGSIPATYGNLTSLTDLNLSINQLSGSMPSSLGNLGVLLYMDLSQNQLTGPIPTTLGNDGMLQSLSLYENQLTGTIPKELGNLSNLQVLDIYSNQLSGTLPKELAQCNNLLHLEVANNLLTGTLPLEYAALVGLETFQINDNQISGAFPPEYLAWTTIGSLYLSNNLLTSLPIFTAPTLINLHVDRNFLKFGDLEPYVGVTDFIYDPQAKLPPGGTLSVNEKLTINIPFSTSGSNNTYQWFKDGVLIPGATMASFSKTNSSPSDAGTYVVKVNNTVVTGLTLQSEDYVITVIPCAVPKPAISASGPLTFCAGGSVILSAPAGYSYTWSTGATTPQITVTTSGAYTVTVSDMNGCVGPVSNPTNVTSVSGPCSNQPPVIAAASQTVPVEGTATITLLPLITDVDNNLDLTTLTILSPPASGAAATIVNGTLSVNYAGVSFSGHDQLTIQVCDVFGACTQQVILLEVIGEIVIYDGISPNGDGLNDYWLIRYIDILDDTKQNKVSVFNRWGDEVFSVENYNNQNRAFSGISNSGNELASGTYFYKIEFASGRSPLTGYLTLKR